MFHRLVIGTLLTVGLSTGSHSLAQAQLGPPGPTGGNAATIGRLEAPATPTPAPIILRQHLRLGRSTPAQRPALSRRGYDLFRAVPALAVLWRRGLLY